MFQGPALGSISDGGYSACLAEFFPHICGSIRLWVPGAGGLAHHGLSRPQHSSWLVAETTYRSLKEGEGRGGSHEGVPRSRDAQGPSLCPELEAQLQVGVEAPRPATEHSRTLSQSCSWGSMGPPRGPLLKDPLTEAARPPLHPRAASHAPTSIPSLPPAPWSDRLPTGRSPSPSQSISCGNFL